MIRRDSTGKSTASLPKAYQTPVDYSVLKIANPSSFLFVFIDDLEEEFTHESGIVIGRTLAKNRDRWGKVVMKHPTSEVIVGEYVLVNKVAEPFPCVIGGLAHWLSYDEHVTAVSSYKSVTETFIGDATAISVRHGPTVDA